MGRFYHKQPETIKIECVQQLSGFCIKAYGNQNFMVTYINLKKNVGGTDFSVQLKNC